MFHCHSSMLTRFFHASASNWNASKSLLGKLRKKTGYSFTNCKKALEANENDLEKAEAWLKQQAKELGWAKATKLAGRKTSQGLIAIATEGKRAAMIEFNCETDFVARNKQFQNMAELISAACLKHIQKENQIQNIFSKVLLDTTQLQSLEGPDTKPLSDHVAILISSVGENVVLRRAACVVVDEQHEITGFVHPSPNTSQTNSMVGKFGSLLIYKDLKSSDKQVNVHDVAKQLCQHIIGMNPSKIGSEDDTPTEEAEDERVMYHQEFLLDPNQYVSEILVSAGIQPVEFLRYECGENLEHQKGEDIGDGEPQVAATAG